MRDLASMFGLHGKVALVTGAATGIGGEIARLFHDADATVVGADLNEAALASQPEDIGRASLFLASDASRSVTGQPLAVDGGFLIS